MILVDIARGLAHDANERELAPRSVPSRGQKNALPFLLSFLPRSPFVLWSRRRLTCWRFPNSFHLFVKHLTFCALSLANCPGLRFRAEGSMTKEMGGAPTYQPERLLWQLTAVGVEEGPFSLASRAATS